MYRITLDSSEAHIFKDGSFVYSLQLDEYPDLLAARNQALKVVENYRTPEQVQMDMITEMAIQSDPAAVAEIITEWQPNQHYRIGLFVQFSTQIYRVVQAHTSQTDWLPDQTPALYTLANKTTTDPVENIPGWVQPTGAHDAYQIGDQIVFDGKRYESTLAGNVYSPIEYAAAWKEI